jgi:large subunit ribosomal protein L18
MKKIRIKNEKRERRRKHIRKNMYGEPERPRMSIYKSLGHIYVQIINDDTQSTLVSASTLDKELREMIKPDMKKKDQSKLVGEMVAKRALDNNITKVRFDRNGFLYHGRVKELADAARKAGLEF